MGEEWPIAWANIRHAVHETAATRDHITPNELAALLDEHEVTGTQARVLLSGCTNWARFSSFRMWTNSPTSSSSIRNG
jgi:hypothetical protein